MHAVKDIDEHSKRGKAGEPHVRRPIERAQQEQVEEYGHGRYPRHQRHPPVLRLPSLRHQVVEDLENGDRYHGAAAEEHRLGQPGGRKLPYQGECDGDGGEGEQEGNGRPGVRRAHRDVAPVDHGVAYHVEDEERADGYEIEEDVEVGEESDCRRKDSCIERSIS